VRPNFSILEFSVKTKVTLINKSEISDPFINKLIYLASEVIIVEKLDNSNSL